MKNIILSVLLASTSSVFAQQGLLNGNFEDTAIQHQNSVTDTIFPHWTFSDFGAGITDDAQSGNFAAMIWNWYYYAHGEITNGDAVFPAKGGTPINFSPSRLTGYYKYIEGDIESQDDSAQAIICVTRYNTSTSKRDTLGYGIKKLAPVPAYTPFFVDVNYGSSDVPDTVTVKFISSVNGFCTVTSTGDCLYLYLDDISISDTITGLSEQISFKDDLQIYPNPASDKFYFKMYPHSFKSERLEIYNAIGEKVLQREFVPGMRSSIDISVLPPGLYQIRVNEKMGKLVKR